MYQNALLFINTTRFYRPTRWNATHGIAKTFLSVHLSVRLSNASIETKRKKLVITFLDNMKDHSF